MTAVGRIVDAAWVLPQGRGLSPEEWQWRHHVVAATILAGSVGMALFAALHHQPGWAGPAGSIIPFLLGAAALLPRGSRRVRAALASGALMAIAMLAIHHFATIEAHFLFFIMVPLVALYEDWIPFATAVGLVIMHHVAGALTDPSLVYNHAGAIESPLMWSVIHSALFLAMCAASVLHWNVNERTRARERSTRDQLRWLSRHDPLTGLVNRVAFEESLQEALADNQRHGASAALLMVDVDGFKQVNDTLGHAAGDKILQEVARRLRSCVRPGDTIGRMGGDEFAIVLPGAEPHSASKIAQRIVVGMAASMKDGAADAGVGVSIGVAVSTEDNADTLMRHADLALYAAKHSGRGQFISYSPELVTNSRETFLVDVADAQAWSRYVHQLRGDVAAAKGAGRLPAQARGPESARRTLEALLAAIDQLPGKPEAHLLLPERNAVEEFVFHHDMVQTWAEKLTLEGVLSTRQPAAAARFWGRVKARITAQPADLARTD